MTAPTLPTVPIDAHVDGHPEWIIGRFIMMPAERARRLRRVERLIFPLLATGRGFTQVTVYRDGRVTEWPTAPEQRGAAE